MSVSLTPGPRDALVIVDVQNDFLPGGALAVDEGDRVIPVINRLIRAFRDARRPIFATRDWHPADHCSFEEQGGPWPVHCVQGTRGAEFAEELDVDEGVTVVSKDFEQDVNSYSGFQHTKLAGSLRADGVERIVVVGLATDYCVMNTALDGLENDLEVVVVEDAIRAVNVSPNDGDDSIRKMREQGVLVIPTPEST